MKRIPLLIGLLIGIVMCFIDSYSYAISGYTTAEISLISIPILIIAIYRLLKLKFSYEDIIISLALAYSMDLSTTLASGMYITYGFLKYASTQLKAFGLEVRVPKMLYAGGNIVDLESMPTYIILSIISFSGALIAYSFRSHFLDKERLRYPFSIASALFIKTFREMSIDYSYIIAMVLGFLLQLLSLIYTQQIDLTPISSSILPGSIIALSFWPITIGIFMLIPMQTLKTLSISSIITYVLLIPISIIMFRIPITPSLTYDDALFSVTPIIIGINVGAIISMLLYYILRFWKTLSISLKLVTSLSAERTIFVMSIILLILIFPTSIALSSTFNPISFIVMIILLSSLYLLLILSNMRVVGEVGTGSQALLPLVTFLMYFLGVRDLGYYASLDPYTGIPMPQVIGATSMNMVRIARFFKVNTVLVLQMIGLGIFIGSITSYVFGNLLVYVYGFNSKAMPLTRWIPTIALIASICNGKLDISSFYAVLIGIIASIIIITTSRYTKLSIFPFLVGITLPPDIGILALIAYAIKSIVVRLGVEVHEKVIALVTFFIVGAGIATAINVVPSLVNIW